MSDLILSASSLDRFFTCPYQFWLSKLWTPLAPPSKQLELGLAVHALMASEKKVTKSTPRDVAWHVKALRDLEKDYDIRDREIESTVQLRDRIKILRRIDAIGISPDGEEVVIDYKTSSYSWDELAEGVYPKAEGFQSACYLWGKDMPSRMDYLVSVENGTTQVCTVRDNLTRACNLLDAARLVELAVSDARFPAHRGWLCRYCAYDGVCYESPGWDTMYKERKETRDDDIE